VDLCNPQSVFSLISEIPKLFGESCPLLGVFHLSGVLNDGAFTKSDISGFRKVTGPKSEAAWYLHEATKNLPSLKLFVLFSSLASIKGNPGQANYSIANAALDALAVHRKKKGLPGISVNWGPWCVGMAGKLSEIARAKLAQTYIFMPASECLDALGHLLVTKLAQVAIFRSAESVPVITGAPQGMTKSLLSGSGLLKRMLEYQEARRWEARMWRGVRREAGRQEAG
jgi:hypothetical protein